MGERDLIKSRLGFNKHIKRGYQDFEDGIAPDQQALEVLNSKVKQKQFKSEYKKLRAAFLVAEERNDYLKKISTARALCAYYKKKGRVADIPRRCVQRAVTKSTGLTVPQMFLDI